MNKKLPLNENLFLEDTAFKDDDGGLVFRDDETGKFYKDNGSGKAEPVSEWKQRDYEQKYYLEVTRNKRAKEAGIDIEAARLKDKERLSGDIKGLGLSVINKASAEAEMYRSEAEDSENRARERRNKLRSRMGTNTAAIKDALELEITDFMNNLAEKVPKYHEKKDMFKPDPFNTLHGSKVKAWKKVKTKKNPDMYNKWEERPVILFFYDRSSSFNPTGHPQKSQLGEALIELFESWSDSCDLLPVVYFATTCHDGNESSALREGGNNGKNTLLGIANRTKGKISNVVILTDDNVDCNYPIEVCGSVWCIFAGSQAPGFYNSIKVLDLPDGTPGKKEYYFFKNLN